MTRRTTFIGDRAAPVAPDRGRRGQGFAAVGRLPIPEILTLALFFIMSGQIWGAIGVALQLGVWMLLLMHMVIFNPKTFLELFKWWPIMLVPLFALASTAWSVVPDVTLRFSIQLILTALIGITIAKAVTARRFVALLFLAMMLMCIVSIMTGRTGPGPNGPVLIGLVGSKNEMAYAAQMLMTASFAVLIDRGQAISLRLGAMAGLVIGLGILALGQAAGAVLTTACSFVVLIAVATLHLFKLQGRLVILAACAIMLTPVVIAHEQITTAVERFVFDAFDKDASLSGRTYLWDRADDLIREKPALGRGWRATMAGGTVEGQGILRWAGVQDGRGFHFHNTYRDLAVDLGFVGMGLFAVTLFGALFALVRNVVFHPTPPYGFFLATVLVVIAKSNGELVINQLILTGSLLFALMVWSYGKPKEDAQWQARVVAPDGALLKRTANTRLAAEPVRIAAPVRSR